MKRFFDFIDNIEFALFFPVLLLGGSISFFVALIVIFTHAY